MSGRAQAIDGGGGAGLQLLYRLQDCHRHLKFCPVFLAGSGGAVGGCCAGRCGLWLPVGASCGTGGGEGVTVGCEKRKTCSVFWLFFFKLKANVAQAAEPKKTSLRTSVNTGGQ